MNAGPFISKVRDNESRLRHPGGVGGAFYLSACFAALDDGYQLVIHQPAETGWITAEIDLGTPPTQPHKIFCSPGFHLSCLGPNRPMSDDTTQRQHGGPNESR